MGFPSSIKENSEGERVEESWVNPGPHLLFLTQGPLSHRNPQESQAFWLKLGDRGGPMGAPRTEMLEWVGGHQGSGGGAPRVLLP